MCGDSLILGESSFLLLFNLIHESIQELGAENNPESESWKVDLFDLLRNVAKYSPTKRGDKSDLQPLQGTGAGDGGFWIQFLLLNPRPSVSSPPYPTSDNHKNYYC